MRRLSCSVLLVGWCALVSIDEPATAVEFPPELSWSVHADGVTFSDGLAFDDAQTLYATEEISPGPVVRILAGGAPEIWVDGFHRPDGIIYEHTTSCFYVSEEATPGTVQRIDASGIPTVVVPAEEIDGPEGLVLHPESGALYIAEDRSPGRIRVFDPATGGISTFVEALDRPEGVAFHPGGDLYVAETGTNSILRITPEAEVYTVASSAQGVVNPDNIIWSDVLRVFLISTDVSPGGRILWLTEEGDVRILGEEIDAPQGMTFAVAGDLYISEQYQDRILRIAAVYSNQVFRIGAGNLSMSSAEISWQSFRRATSQVEYGLTAAYGAWTAIDTALTIEHTRALTDLEVDTTYHYRVHSVAADGTVFVSGDHLFTTTEVPTSVYEEQPIESLAPRFTVGVLPNPSVAGAAFHLELSAQSRVRIEIFDVAGRRVQSLPERALAAGRHRIMWDGRSSYGRELPRGVYLYRVLAEAGEQVGRIVRMR